MELSQELLSKLARRRFLSEGISPEVALRSLVKDAKEEVPKRTCKHVELPDWAEQASAVAASRKVIDAKEQVPKRTYDHVMLPDWAKQADAAARKTKLETEARALSDYLRLRATEVERDAACRAVACLETEIAVQNTLLVDEVHCLNRSAETLREELAAAQSQASHEITKPIAGSKEFVALQREREEFKLEARAQSLILERKKQSADVRLLEEQLRASQTSLASIQDEIDTLEKAESEILLDAHVQDKSLDAAGKTGEEKAADEDPYAAPLVELQDTLASLVAASSSHSH